MHNKTGPDFLRQTITRFWQYNLYVQKPFDSGYSFIALFKLNYMLEIFLNIFRPAKLNLRNNKIRKTIKKTTYKLIEASNFKLINFRLGRNQNNLIFFCNLGSRTHMFPTLLQNIQYNNIKFKFQKKLNFFKYTFFLLKKKVFSSSFIKYLFYKSTNKFNKITNKFYNFQKFYFLKKKKNRIENIKQKSKKKNGIIQNFKNNLKNKKELNQWFFDSQKFNRLVLRSLNKRKIVPSKKIKYSFVKLQKKKFILKIFLKKINNLKFLSLKSKKVNFKIIKKLKLKKNILWNLLYNKKKIYKLFINKLKQKKYYYTNFKHSFMILPKKFTKLLLLNSTKTIFTKKNLKIFWKFNFFNTFKNMELLNFIYIQIFNKILEHKIENFLFKNFKIHNTNIFLQQEFSFPNANYLLQLMNKRIKKTTFFLKSNNKFYNNFLNIIPIIQNFNAINILAKQIALELERTKKHWKVIKGIELLIMQSFIQLKKEPIESKSNMIGLRVIITGRPNKSSRTKKIIFQFGRITKASFSHYNVFQTFASGNAQIGSFGITILALT